MLWSRNCDGVGANVSAIKSTCGTYGAYGIGLADDRHKVDVSFPIHLNQGNKSSGSFVLAIK